MIFLLTLLPPLACAIILGWRAGRVVPETRQAFAREVGFALLWSVAFTFLWQALWVSAAIPAPWFDTVRSAFNLTFASQLICAPILVISYIIRAIRERRA